MSDGVHRGTTFHWSAGGWFGSLAGGTLWMLIGAVLLFPQTPALSVVWLLGFAICNSVGLYLWRQRNRLRCYFAIQTLVACIGLVALLVWSTTLVPGADIAPMLGTSVQRGFLFITIFFPAIMLVFWWKERFYA